MAYIIGPSPGTNCTLNAGAAIRFRWGWTDSPAGRNIVLFFAIPPNIRTDANRVVSYNILPDGRRRAFFVEIDQGDDAT